jgi:hypothetical protein
LRWVAHDVEKKEKASYRQEDCGKALEKVERDQSEVE